MNRNKTQKTSIPAVIIILLSLLSGCSRQDTFQLSLDNNPVYVCRGFDAADVNRLPDGADPRWAVVPGNPAGKETELALGKLFPGNGKSGRPGGRHFLSPFMAGEAEWTVVIPFALDGETLARLRNTRPPDSGGPVPVPGLHLNSIGDNWVIYLNGTPVRTELHLDDKGAIVSHRNYNKGVSTPVPPELFRPGFNLLAFRIIGSPDSHFTGFVPSSVMYLGDYAAMERRSFQLLYLIVCALCLYLSFYHLLLYAHLLTEKYYLYFSIFFTIAGIYFFTQFGIFYGIAKDITVLTEVGVAALYVILPAFSAFLEELLYGRVRKPVKVYGIICAFLAAIQFCFTQAFRQDMQPLWICLMIPGVGYIIGYDLVYGFYLEVKKAGHTSILVSLAYTPQGNLIIGSLIMLISVVVEAANDVLFDIPWLIGFSQYGSIAFALCMVFVMSHRFFNMYLDLNASNESLTRKTEELRALNDSTFRFVPSQFMRSLGVNDITRLTLGENVQKELTVLFFDIRSFSIHSEMMSVNDNFAFINRVLGAAGPIIRKHSGFVDKYLGDAAMVLFEDAASAVQAGIELYQTLILNEGTRITIGGDPINIGIGIHTGVVMLGIVGENERLSSTVISKNVNMASRLESLTKQTGSGLLVSRDTINRFGPAAVPFEGRFIGMVKPAGVNEVVGVIDVLDALDGETRRRRLAARETFESGVRMFHTKKYQAAAERFQQVVSEDPSDICALNCLAETRNCLGNPSLPSVFTFERK